MNFERFLAIKNLKKHPLRTAALMLLSAFLAMSVFGGSVIVRSLRNGLESYQARLGADIVVVPYEARTKGTFESILLQGIPGNFYMDDKYFRKIQSTEGVEQAAPQFYLASTSSGCCSVAVQIIGYDPDADFLVQPWIKKSYSGTLETGDVIVGSKLTVPKDRTLTFYNVPCRVAAQLEETGTGLDTAVYANMDTIREMITNARALGFHYFDDINADRAVSSVMVRVADGYDIEEVTGDINIHVRHVVASQAGSLVSGIAGGLKNVARIISILTVMIWMLAIAILVLAFLMISHERAREFAMLRVMGASRGMVSRLLLTESALISLLGSAVGLVLAALMVIPFSGLISSRLQLPYLMPDAGQIALTAVLALAVSVLCGALTSAVAAYRISRQDTGLILREGM